MCSQGADEAAMLDTARLQRLQAEAKAAAAAVAKRQLPRRPLRVSHRRVQSSAAIDG